jgi:ABC-type multidrug transport system ATPase subunit
MVARLELDSLSLVGTGPALNLKVSVGQSLGVLGRAGAGKSQLLRVLHGAESPARGRVHRPKDTVLTETLEPSRRMKPQQLAARSGGKQAAERGTEVLVATHLWDRRQDSLTDLTPSQVAACELLGPLASDARMILVDGQLDRLDPWCLASTMALVKRRMAEGAILVVATHRPDIAAGLDALAVLDDRQIRFAGTPDELIRQTQPTRLVVRCQDQPGVRALVEPFEVRVRVVEDGLLEITARDGQQLAHRLLLEGYGNVEMVVLRPPSLEEALLALLGPTPARSPHAGLPPAP